MFRRILIANRGEIAVRVEKACKEMGIQSVAVFSEADRESPHVRKADIAVAIGGSKSSESYLNMEAILQAASQYECQAIHPGFGFLSENALFSEMCRQARITFIGPTPEAIRLMGDKSPAKQTMRKAGLPTIPGSDKVMSSLEEVTEICHKTGFPVLLKATAGGGGKGMRVCHSSEGLRSAFQEASLEAEKAFGNPGLYIEKYIEGGRHIEFQVLADVYGNVVYLGERECSIQRKHQKLVEECLSPAISPQVRQDMGKMVVDAIRKIGYLNAGTVEFLMDPQGNLYFMEMNTRLQVEHPVTEKVTGIDIVKEQIKIAANMPLSFSQKDITFKGHAIECRINAEDPEKEFRPSPGKIEHISIPNGDGIRVDTHVCEGYTIPPYYDSMIAKLIVHAEDRQNAIALMAKALNEFGIEGVKTTIGLHKRIMADEEFIAGRYSTQFIPKRFKL